ncbi:hypothetical protein BDL97_03G073400 [Sphagnum fallax]|nr:hypothetical protein BDL97_03G073400 [Sphagnum fallax]
MIVSSILRRARYAWQRIATVTAVRHGRAPAVPDERFQRYNSPVPSRIDHTPILSTPELKLTTLPNGFRVATESNLSADSATFGVWIDAGSRFEADATNEEIENMGAHLNAYTSREQTTFCAKVLKKDVSAAVNSLADILQNSSFDEDRISRERNVILREMEEVEGRVEEVMFDHLHATAFQYSPLSHTILGPAENIHTITQADLKSYIILQVLAAAGAVRHDELVRTAQESFKNLSTNPITAGELVEKEPAFFTGSEVRFHDDDVPLAYFAVAVKHAARTDPDSIALMVVQTMLGAWSKNAGAGKHMGVMAFNTNYSDAGLFGVCAVAKPDHLDDLAYVIMHEMARMIYRVDSYDAGHACNQLKSCLLLHLDGTSPIAEDIDRQNYMQSIDAVDVDTVKRVANCFIFDKEVAITAIGPIQFFPDYNWFCHCCYWNRYSTTM